jgi:hypothetical protein
MTDGECLSHQTRSRCGASPAFMLAKPSLISDSFSLAEIQSSRCNLPPLELDQTRYVEAKMIAAHRRALDPALAQEIEAVELDGTDLGATRLVRSIATDRKQRSRPRRNSRLLRLGRVTRNRPRQARPKRSSGRRQKALAAFVGNLGDAASRGQVPRRLHARGPLFRLSRAPSCLRRNAFWG